MARISEDRYLQYSFRVLVAGSRSFNDTVVFNRYLRQFLRSVRARPEELLIISGMAKSGADYMAIEWAEINKIDWLGMPAEWDNLEVEGAVIKKNAKGEDYNVLAGFNRNEKMAKVCTHAAIFWDMSSPGTKDMITRCLKNGVSDTIIFPVIDQSDIEPF